MAMVSPFTRLKPAYQAPYGEDPMWGAKASYRQPTPAEPDSFSFGEQFQEALVRLLRMQLFGRMPDLQGRGAVSEGAQSR